MEAVDEGKKVNVKIVPVYGGKGGRPDRFMISYSINGVGRFPSTSRTSREVFDGRKGQIYLLLIFRVNKSVPEKSPLFPTKNQEVGN